MASGIGALRLLRQRWWPAASAAAPRAPPPAVPATARAAATTAQPPRGLPRVAAMGAPELLYDRPARHFFWLVHAAAGSQLMFWYSNTEPQ